MPAAGICTGRRAPGGWRQAGGEFQGGGGRGIPAEARADGVVEGGMRRPVTSTTPPPGAAQAGEFQGAGGLTWLN